MNKNTHKIFALFLISCSLLFSHGLADKKSSSYYHSLDGFRRAVLNKLSPQARGIHVRGIGTPEVDSDTLTYIKNNTLKIMKEDYYKKYLAKSHYKSDEDEFLKEIEEVYLKLCAPAYNKLADVDAIIHRHMMGAFGTFKNKLRDKRRASYNAYETSCKSFEGFLDNFKQDGAQPILDNYLQTFKSLLQNSLKEFGLDMANNADEDTLLPCFNVYDKFDDLD